MIDPHGEYESSLAGKCRVFRVGANSALGEEDLCVPFWALPFKELIAIFPGRLSDQNEDYIRNKVLEKKRLSAAAIGGLREEAITADSPIPFSINQLWFDLDDFERITFRADRVTAETRIADGDPTTFRSNQYPTAGIGSSAPFLNNKAKGILGFLDAMRSRILDQRYNFLFRPIDYSPSLDGTTNKDLPELFSTWFGHGFPISILDLSAMREMADVLSSLRTGEAIVSGEAVRIPSRIKFFQAENAGKSADPVASQLWTNPRPDIVEYETSVRNWRNQSFH